MGYLVPVEDTSPCQRSLVWKKIALKTPFLTFFDGEKIKFQKCQKGPKRCFDASGAILRTFGDPCMQFCNFWPFFSVLPALRQVFPLRPKGPARPAAPPAPPRRPWPWAAPALPVRHLRPRLRPARVPAAPPEGPLGGDAVRVRRLREEVQPGQGGNYKGIF